MIILVLISFLQSCLIPSEYKSKEFDEINTTHETYYIKRSGGIVLKCVNDTLVRIDNSYDYKIQNNSLNFIYQNEIYRFGGYGFYHEHKVMVKYNELINSWERIQLDNIENIEGFSHIGFHFITKDQLFFFGTQTNDQKYFQKGFSINLKRGRLDHELVLNKQFINPYSYVQNKNQLILFYRKKSQLIIYNLDTESLKSFSIPKEISNSVVPQSELKVKDEDLVFITSDINSNEVNFKLDLNVIENNSIQIDESFYSKTFNFKDYKYILLIPFSLLLVIIVIRFKRVKEYKLVMTEKGLSVNKKIFIDDKEQIKIINLLLEQTKVYNQDLNDLFSYKNQNSIHINRYKNQLIDKINLKLFEIVNEDIITKTKDESDKRISLYQIKENYIHYK